MKIISKFEDYYDKCYSNFAVYDNDIVYKRLTKKCDALTSFKLKEAHNFNTVKRINDLTFFIIIFCGHLYKGLKIKDDIVYTINGAKYISNQYLDLFDVHFNNQFEKVLTKVIKKPIYLVYPSSFFNLIEIYEDAKLTDLHFYKTMSPINAFMKIEQFVRRQHSLPCLRLINSIT